jgi:hypothetical protein
MASIRGSQSVLARGQRKLHIPSSRTFYVTTTHFVPQKFESLGGCHDTVPGCASTGCMILCGFLEAFSSAIPKCHSFNLAPSYGIRMMSSVVYSLLG